MKTCLIYVRVSDEEQLKGKSIDDQIKVCTEFALEKAWEVRQVFKDEGKSAAENLKNRKGILEALLTAEGQTIDYLVVTETDRFARNVKHHIFLKEQFKKAGCVLFPVSQQFVADDSPMNQALDNMMAVMNQLQSQLNGLKTARAMQKKIERGEWPGWAPVGFVNVNVGTEEKPHNVIRVHLTMGVHVKETLELFSTGNYKSIEKLNAIMYAKGLRSKHGKKMPLQSFIDMLRNPFYYGMMRFKDDMYANEDENGNQTYEPLISKEVFQRNQEILVKLNKGANRTRKHDAKFFLRHFLECGICGGKITAELHEKKKVSYYHCSLTRQKKHSNKGQNINSNELEGMIAKEFKKIQLTGALMDKIVARAKEILAETRSGLDGKRRGIQNRIQKLEQRKDNLTDDRADKLVEPEEYTRKYKEYTEEIRQLKKQLTELDNEREDNIDIFSKLMALTDDLHNTYTKAEPNLKEHLIGLFFDKFVLRDKKITKVKYTKAVQVLLENRSVIINQDWLPDLDSNQEPSR